MVRNRVDERSAVVVGVVSAVLCALGAPAPTGTGWADTVLLLGAGFAVAWAAASASWWVIGVANLVAAVAARDVAVALMAMVGFAIALFIGVKRRNQPELRAVSGLLAVNALARSELDVFFGSSALVAVVVGAFVVVMGVLRRPRALRVAAEAVAIVAGLVAVAGVVGFGVAAGMARAPLSDGNSLARDGLSALNEGDFDAAARSFEAARRAFVQAADELDAPWGAVAQVVPVVAQHEEAARQLAREAADASATLVGSVRAVDVDALRLQGGRIDISAVTALQQPFADLAAAVDGLRSAVDDVDSPWLVPPVTDRLRVLDDDLVENGRRLDNAISAVSLAPQLLGAQETRHYLVLFTTPAEARGLVGFPGNYAVLRARDGQLTMTTFGRVGDLTTALLANPDAEVTGPQEYLDRYAGFITDAGRPATYTWRNLTMSPDFPSVAEAAADLFPRSGGRQVDGVIAMDPFVLQRLVSYTGPIRVEGYGKALNGRNLANVLLKEQYRLEGKGENAQRIDFLEQAASATIERVLGGGLPGPVQLARDLGPLAAQGRLVMWTRDAAEQTLLRNVHVIGAFPTFDGGDGVAVDITNVGGNKIDTYLQRSVRYESFYETSTDLTRGSLTLTLTNTAPASGLPDYVIGNQWDLPKGTNRMRLCIHTPLQVEKVEVEGDDTDQAFRAARELGMNVYCRPTIVPSRSTVTVTMELVGQLSDPGQEPVIWEQPLVNPLVVETSP